MFNTSIIAMPIARHFNHAALASAYLSGTIPLHHNSDHGNTDRNSSPYM
jgi:hypothetical protein